jgi:hypothetical protein
VTLRHTPLLIAVLLSAGCANRAVQNEAAVRQGVIDYISQRSDLNLTTMQIDVTSVSFRQNEADATVSFRPKGGAADSGMQMRYTLERKGSRWVVKGRGRNGQGQTPHGMGQGQNPHGMGQMPPGAAAPPAGEAQPGSKLPAGHPPIGRPSETGK